MLAAPAAGDQNIDFRVMAERPNPRKRESRFKIVIRHHRLGRRRRHNPAWIWVFLVLLANRRRGLAFDRSKLRNGGAYAPLLLNLANLLGQQPIDSLRPRPF